MQFRSKAWRAEAYALGSTAVAVTATMAAQLSISAVESLAVARLGVAVLAGVTLALSLHLLAFLFTLGVVTAVTPLAAQAHGRGDGEEASRFGRQGYDDRLEQDMIAIPIGPRIQRLATAASPAYLDRAGRPGHPRDLLHHPAILRHFAGGALTSPWGYERDGEIVRIEPRSRLIVRVGAAVDLGIDAASASSTFSRTGCALISIAAHWSRCWRSGGSPSPARSSTTSIDGWCRPRCAPSSAMSWH